MQIPKMIFNLRNKYLVPIVFFMFAQALQPVEAQQVCSLSECVKTGLENNFSLQIVRNKQDIVQNNYTRGNAGMLPSIDATGTYGGNVRSSGTNYTNGTSEQTDAVLNTNGGAAINLNLPVFRGFQVQNTYKKLGVLSERSQLETQMAVENFVAEILSEYFYFVQQITLYNNMAYAVSLSRERVRIDEERYLLGAASKVELLQSKVYLNADSSQYSRQKENLRTSQIKLNALMAKPDLGSDIAPADTFIRVKDALIFDELLQNTLVNNTGLLIAKQNQKISDLDYKIIQSRAYPYLNFNSGYSYNYQGYGVGNIQNQQNNGINYGLSFGVDIFDGFNRQREKQNARIELINQEIQYNSVEQELRADLLTVYYAYENNLRLLRLEEENLEVARENLEIALERYKLGSLSGIELREVQKSLLDAEERLISVKYSTKLAEITLYQISGNIMQYVQ